MFALGLVLTTFTAKAGGLSLQNAKPGLSLSSEAQAPTLFGKKKHRGKHWLAGGVVFGQPAGFGGRVLVTPWRLGFVADFAFDQIRLDNGYAAGAMTVKVDARWYGKGFLKNFFRPYMFGGITTTLANFNEFDKSLIRADAGVGAEVRIWRVGLNAEAGLLLPLEYVQNYHKGVGFFGNIGVVFFIL